MARVDIGGGHWLDASAAASLARVEKRLGRKLDVNDAGRTRDEQANLYYRYYTLGDRSFGRPAKPGTSPHETGLAIDTDDRIGWIGEHGWIQNVSGEPWHFQYFAANDRHKSPAPAQALAVRRGSRGTLVRAVQARLNRDYPLYSKLVVDGIFGPKTEAVVREFQRRAGLVVDGIVGPKTLAKLGL